jgi:hypothetical protein
MKVKLDSKKQEYPFNVLFSEQFINSYDRSEFSSIEALSTYLEENEAKISKETINTYKGESLLHHLYIKHQHFQKN